MRFWEDVPVVIVIAAASVSALSTPLHDGVFVTPLRAEFAEVLPHTAWAAARVWTFWAVAAAILGAVLLRLDSTLGVLDAVIGGLVGVWVLAFVAGNTLGPIGLLRGWTIWAGLAAAALWLWRMGPPRIERRSLTPGLLMALLCFVLIAPPMMLVELGSPVPPFMDVLATPASAQRILTFGRYLPFDNDPYGYWDAASQCPATELLYAFLALGSGTSLATLAETAAIVPMTGLLILVTYRLGKTIGGDVAGGMATLFLCATVLFNVLPYMHGRTVAHVPVAAGVAFLLDERRNTTRLTLGALALGTAVGAHAVVGALGMAVAAGTMLFWLVAGHVACAVAGIGLLAGATLLAVPEIAIAVRRELPYPILPLAQIAGVAIIMGCARLLHDRTAHVAAPARWLGWALTLLVLAGLFIGKPRLLGGLQDHHNRFPLLFATGALGLALMLWQDVRRSAHVLLIPVAVALIVGIALEQVSQRWWQSFSDPRVRIAVNAFYRKVDYWYPYVLVFPAGCLAAWLYRRVSPRLALLAVLALLLYPWKPFEHTNPNYHQRSVTEFWALKLAIAKTGYWTATGHRRWAQTAAERELAEVLRAEVAAGRITPATHVVHLEPWVLLYEDVVLFSVYTGINDDTFIAGGWKQDVSNVGGRAYPAADVVGALAAGAPYAVIHDVTRNNRKLEDFLRELPSDAFRDYEAIFDRDGVRLLRHRTLGPAS